SIVTGGLALMLVVLIQHLHEGGGLMQKRTTGGLWIVGFGLCISARWLGWPVFQRPPNLRRHDFPASEPQAASRPNEYLPIRGQRFLNHARLLGFAFTRPISRP